MKEIWERGNNKEMIIERRVAGCGQLEMDRGGDDAVEVCRVTQCRDGDCGWLCIMHGVKTRGERRREGKKKMKGKETKKKKKKKKEKKEGKKKRKMEKKRKEKMKAS